MQPQTAVIYTDDPERLAKVARLLPTDTGANVVLAQPFDPIVFDRIRTDGSYPRVSVAQTAAHDSTSRPTRALIESRRVAHHGATLAP